VTLGAGNHTIRFTVTGKNASSTAFTLSVDRIILVPVSSTLSFEAESVSFATNGAIAAIQTDANTSGGQWLALEGNGAGDYIEFTTPSLAAGTYQIQMSWKGNTSRAIIQPSVDGSNLGGTIDQYSATQVYPTSTFGSIALGAGTHKIRLTVTGQNASSTSFWISADKFTLTGQ